MGVREWSRGSFTGWLVLIVFALGVGAFLFVVRRDRRPIAIGGIPVLEEIQASGHLRFGPLTRSSQVQDIARIANAVFKENAMPRELIAELHWHSRDSVVILEDPAVGVVGYVSLMVPTPALKALIFAGQTDPLKWSANDFAADANRWHAGWVYLESVAVWPKVPTYTLIVHKQWCGVSRNSLRRASSGR
jgi:hypothetical protein